MSVGSSTTTNAARKARVLALITDAFGGHGGIAQYNRDLLAGLSEMDAVERVEALVRLQPGSSELRPGKIHQAEPMASRIRYSLRAGLSALSQSPTMVFNGHLYHSPLSRLVARLAGAKLVSQLHGTEVWGDVPGRYLWPLERSDLVLCVSRDTERRILDLAPGLAGRTHVLHNTVGPNFAPRDRHLARQRFDLKSEKVILTVARLDDRGGYKGHERILRLMPQISANFPGGLIYLIAGDGPDRSRLERIAGELGITHLVRFLGRVPSEDLPDLYSAADVFAMPSTGEGFGIVYLEAMACGTPAIGLDVGGVPDAFGDGAIEGCVSSRDFERTLTQFLERPRVEHKALSAQVVGRYGAAAFNARLKAALQDHGIING